MQNLSKYTLKLTKLNRSPKYLSMEHSFNPTSNRVALISLLVVKKINIDKKSEGEIVSNTL